MEVAPAPTVPTALCFCSLHPTRDVVLETPRLALGGVVRAAAWFSYPAGKALNAARTAGGLGGRVRALVMAPPGWRRRLREFLGNAHVGFRLLPVGGEGRICVILGERARETVINTDLALRLTGAQRVGLAAAVRRAARRSGFLVFAGSLPPSLGSAAVRELLRLATSGRARLALDQSGRWLREGIRHRPWVIKPNMTEFETLVGRRMDSLASILDAAEDVRGRGVGRVLLSLGRRGCVLVSSAGRWFAPALPSAGPVTSPVGCGDAMFGAFLRAAAAGEAEPDALAWGVAAATANLGRRGACLFAPEEARALRPRVRVRRV